MAPILNGVANQDEMGILRSGDCSPAPADSSGPMVKVKEPSASVSDVFIHYFLITLLHPSSPGSLGRVGVTPGLAWSGGVSGQTVMMEIVYREDAEDVIDIGHQHLAGRALQSRTR